MDTKLLELLVCPVTKGPLTWHPEKQELCSRSARLAYPVREASSCFAGFQVSGPLVTGQTSNSSSLVSIGR